ncbi:hypothetical protein [Amycolatopsis methanolica]|uniref:Uncharacterized protein n=1 Tax=Amycolatopsis methanolica 239 TaxID=1068978 RepID=A0A076N519_AMYME|nr:hypothetical protein [Amycolatopsis methanolica]AIJ26347.1 hypothetical protein AMETH_6255 [Amycolatopsis methanolica 239]AIJ26406.1 hypothetical protein AMETH_6314 [Amycolatopsis methanolica 239]
MTYERPKPPRSVLQWLDDGQKALARLREDAALKVGAGAPLDSPDVAEGVRLCKQLVALDEQRGG